MKAKAIVTTVLLAASNFAAANGGLGIDNVEQHMDAINWADTQANQQEIIVQGALDRFQDYAAGEVTVVDVNQLKQAYDGQS